MEEKYKRRIGSKLVIQIIKIYYYYDIRNTLMFDFTELIRFRRLLRVLHAKTQGSQLGKKAMVTLFLFFFVKYWL